MGVKKFTRVFSCDKEITFKELKGKTIAVDALVEIYRAMLGMTPNKRLTDATGNPTSHINIIFSLILNLHKSEINQIWVFDNIRSKDYEKNKDKIKELEIRQKKRKKAQERIDILEKNLDINNEQDLEQFLSEEIKEGEKNEKQEEKEESKEEKIKKINMLKKRIFSIKSWMIDDIKFMLDKMNISWIDAPHGYEGEHLAAYLTKHGIADAVLSSDTDTLVFGAKQLIKRDTKKSTKNKKMFLLYTLSELFKTYKIDQDSLIKVSLCLGTDFNPNGIKLIGEKTVLKKYKKIDQLLDELDDVNIKKTEDRKEYLEEIKNAFNQFKRECPVDITQICNYNEKPLSDQKKISSLLDWLELEKNFNRKRLETMLNKVI